MLKSRGIEKLEEFKKVELFDGEIEPNNEYKYGVDYQLGDTVTILNKYGIESAPQITGVIESVSEQGIDIVPTFSEWITE